MPCNSRLGLRTAGGLAHSIAYTSGPGWLKTDISGGIKDGVKTNASAAV
jgi:hypothetical protein